MRFEPIVFFLLALWHSYNFFFNNSFFNHLMRLAKKEEKNLTWAVWEMLVFYLDLHLEWPYFDRWNLVSEGLFWESVYCLSKCRHCLSISLPFQKSIESLSLRQWNKLYTKKNSTTFLNICPDNWNSSGQ